MPRSSKFIKLRNQAMLCKYKKMQAVKEHGVSKHSFAWIINELAYEHFFLDPTTIERIIRQEPENGY